MRKDPISRPHIYPLICQPLPIAQQANGINEREMAAMKSSHLDEYLFLSHVRSQSSPVKADQNQPDESLPPASSSLAQRSQC